MDMESLRKNNPILGMPRARDGVKDTPSLEKANVGIAGEEAADAAKSAADIVLTEPGLSVISKIIKINRRIFQRISRHDGICADGLPETAFL